VIDGLRHVRIVQASAGSGHSLFVSEYGELYACGDFRHGKLGLGQKLAEDVLIPTRVECKPPPDDASSSRRARGKTKRSQRQFFIVSASAWHAHSLVVTACGTLLSFGCGVRGRLGHGDERNRSKPNVVRALRGTPIAVACAGELHSCVLSRDGSVYCFGDSTLGQTAVTDGHPLLEPTRLPTRSPVSECAVGDHHTMVRLCTGELLAFGKNLEGQLGLGTPGDLVFEPTRVRWPGERSRDVVERVCAGGD